MPHAVVQETNPHTTPSLIVKNIINSRFSSMVRGVVRPEGDNLTGSMALLEGAQPAGNEASYIRQGGKRPRTTSSIFAAAATGMLTSRLMPTSEATALSFAKQQHACHHEQQPDALLCLRENMGSGRVSAPSAACDRTAGSAKPRGIPGSTATANAAVVAATTAVFRSDAADAMIRGERSSREDELGEAAAMAADERRSSPPTPPPDRLVGYHGNKGGKRQANSPQLTLIDHSPGGALSQADPFDLRTQEDSDGYLVEAEAVASRSFFINGHHRGSLSPPAPSFEPSPLNEHKSTAGMPWQYNSERHLKATACSSPEETRQLRHGSAAARAKDGDLELAKANGFSSRAPNVSSPQYHEAERKVRVEVEGDRHRLTKSTRQRVPAISSVEGERSPSPRVDRQDFLSTMKKSDDAYQRVREDLLLYMEGVRTR